jgi:hypothetical protein
LFLLFHWEEFVGRLAISTDEEIIAAGIAIENEGKPVSAFAIRNVLKGGCSDRIKLLWNEFIEQRGSRELEVDVANKIDLPPELQDLLEKNSKLFQEKLTTLAMDCYRVSQLISKERIDSLTEDYKKEVSYFESAEQQAIVALNSVDSGIERLENDLELSEKRYHFELAEKNKFKGIIETLEKRLEQLEVREDEHLKLQRHFGKIEEKLKSLNS